MGALHCKAGIQFTADIEPLQ